MAKGKKASVPLKASVPANSNKKAVVAAAARGKTPATQQLKKSAAPVKNGSKKAPVEAKKQQQKKQVQKEEQPSETESSGGEEEDEDNDDDEEDDDGDDEDDSEDDEFEDQGSSSEDESEGEEGDDDEDQLTEAERKTRKFTIDREKQMQQMRDDGSLKIASQLHIDDLSSDDEENINTIGNVPLRWYEEYDHIGYDVEGKKIMKSNAGGDGIDNAIAAKDDPNYEYVSACSLCICVVPG